MVSDVGPTICRRTSGRPFAPFRFTLWVPAHRRTRLRPCTVTKVRNHVLVPVFASSVFSRTRSRELDVRRPSAPCGRGHVRGRCNNDFYDFSTRRHRIAHGFLTQARCSCKDAQHNHSSRFALRCGPEASGDKAKVRAGSTTVGDEWRQVEDNRAKQLVRAASVAASAGGRMPERRAPERRKAGEEEEGGGEEGGVGWSGAAAAAAGEAMVTARRAPCQANRGRDAAGNVLPCKRENKHSRLCTGQRITQPSGNKRSEKQRRAQRAGVAAMKRKRAELGWKQAKHSRLARERRVLRNAGGPTTARKFHRKN
jgi:hypothetical protein